MKVVSIQMNPLLGDFHYNAKLILSLIKKAPECDLIVLPELALFGYWPGALLERASIVEQQLKVLDSLHQKIPSKTAVLVGAVTKNKKKYGKYYHNSAVLLKKREKPRIFHKEVLPTYDIFDESRYFQAGHVEDNFFKLKGKRILVTICEDIWASDRMAWAGSRFPQDPLKHIKKDNVDFIVNLSASPFSVGKSERRLRVIQNIVKKFCAPMVYTNMVGAQDEIIFDGGSVFVDKDKMIQSKYFEEDIKCYEFQSDTDQMKTFAAKKINTIDCMKQALVLGIKDFVKKAGRQHVHLGVSGGLDSALVACLAVEALGPQHVTAIALPGPFSADLSYTLAQKLVKNLGCQFIHLPIKAAYKKTAQDIKTCGIPCSGITSENIQPRLRSLYLMAFANHNKSLLLSTSNKSEMAVGYTTLYGDMTGALSPIGDVLKTQVYEIATACYASLIPDQIISRPPTAELSEGQKDTDVLLEYDQIDASIERLVVRCEPAHNAADRWLLKNLRSSEFKRWQAPPILRVSEHSFGRGRKCPIHYFTER